MPTFWRISDYFNLEGKGGLRASGRWSTEGRPIVYLGESPAACMVERLVHLFEADGDLPETYKLLEIEVPEAVSIVPLAPLLDLGWKEHPEFTQRSGDECLASFASPIARVPSAVVPRTFNYLLNPLHSDSSQVRILSQTVERFDARLFVHRVR